ncbi:lipopolysaccharide assembly protein LapA domain-containing protein [Streptomyces sp. NPDC059122]|uniref:lipopolysaccharide assembly protein LapA domain-containing protein n=1 Tax=Streptomyces sp. NPDC059122 TaxID=3346732 RepID=UPI0036A07076
MDVSCFGAHGHVPLRVALLLAAVVGTLLTALAGSARIMQLRATAREHRRADHRAVKAKAKDSSKTRR